MTISANAMEFFHACETGQGWDACKGWCHDGATFSCQADALGEVTTLEGYCDWMKGLFTPVPDGHYELKAHAADGEQNTVLFFAVFEGTNTGEGGPVPPTGKTAASEYVYAIEFDGDKIRHMTKIWNDVQGLRQFGWA